MSARLKKSAHDQDSTSEKLIQAALAEFNEHGFGGTDTNKIARRAGFAPQTFYRWFEDKIEIFIKAYERWQREELATLTALLADDGSDLCLAGAVVAHHEANLVFRRSLRQLAVENDAVRAARAASRLNQIVYLKSMISGLAQDDAALAAILLQTERLADGLAENEFADMGLEKKAGQEALARLIHQLRSPT